MKVNDIEQGIVLIHNAYLPYRPPSTPFPRDSVLTWCFVQSIQRSMGCMGDSLEIGVQHGGTAFMLAASMLETEKLYLVDLKKSKQFEEIFNEIPKSISDRINFSVCSSKSEELDFLENGRFRFIHIDGDHGKHGFISDFKRFSTCVQKDGIICLDDVFEIRWPGITEGLFEIFPKDEFSPVLIVDRKLYIARKETAPIYCEAIDAAVPALEKFAAVRKWEHEFLILR